MRYKLILFFISGVIAVSCGNKEAEKRAEEIKQKKLTIPEEVSKITTIGRIEPENGLVDISSETGGLITKTGKKAGDSIRKGDTLLVLKADAEKSKEEIIRNQILAQEARLRADQSAIKQYEAQLDELTADIKVSERLAKTGAETRQNLEVKRKDLKVIQSNLNTAQENAEASRADIRVLQSQMREATINTSNRIILAPYNGVLVSNDAKLGSSVSAFTIFATMAPDEPLVVHGEIDEMFASQVALDNPVNIRYQGTEKVIATGRVSFLSPVLSDKSLFYDVPGEQSDRRVRRFKATLENTEGLLINEKVECQIELQ